MLNRDNFLKYSQGIKKKNRFINFRKSSEYSAVKLKSLTGFQLNLFQTPLKFLLVLYAFLF